MFIELTEAEDGAKTLFNINSIELVTSRDKSFDDDKQVTMIITNHTGISYVNESYDEVKKAIRFELASSKIRYKGN